MHCHRSPSNDDPGQACWTSASHLALDTFGAKALGGTIFLPDPVDTADLPARPGSFIGLLEGTPGIVRSNSGTGGGAGVPSTGSSDSSSSREGRLAHTTLQTKASPIMDTKIAVNFPDGSGCGADFILPRIKHHARKITESRFSRNNRRIGWKHSRKKLNGEERIRS